MSWDSLPEKDAWGSRSPDYTRSQMGLRSKRAGEQFEALITASLNWYSEKGIAFVEKTPEPMRPLRQPNRQGQFLACYTKAGQPDFKGTLAGGRAVVFEAKHTDKDRITYDRLTDEQVKAMALHHSLGAAVFIAAEFGTQDFYRIPWENWAGMKAIYGRKYILKSELELYRVPFVSGILKLLDGLEAPHMDTDGWIPATERLPDDGTGVIVTVRHAHWISDYGSDAIPKEEWNDHPEYYEVCGAVYTNGEFVKLDSEDMAINYLPARQQDDNIAYPVEEITAWMPFPMQYAGKGGTRS